jgi:hypothetical protein
VTNEHLANGDANLAAVLELTRAQGRRHTADNILGLFEVKERPVDRLQEEYDSTEREYIAARQTIQNLEQQHKGLQVHCQRLEGALMALERLGAKRSGQLAVEPSHPANANPRPVSEPEAEPEPEQEPTPEPEPAE